MSYRLRIATRKSPLAQWQANHVVDLLTGVNEDLSCELVLLSTRGDETPGASLADAGGKGLFLKELELALISGEVDLAVHSMKDVPTQLDSQFRLSSIGIRGAVNDVLVSALPFERLSKDAKIGTSSVRRKALLGYLYQRSNIENVRGNVQTRLKKLDSGQVDALVLAGAGLERLGISSHVMTRFSARKFVPSPGQGILAVEYLQHREDIAQLLVPCVDAETEAASLAERHITSRLGADCALPMGVHCAVDNQNFDIHSIVLDPQGQKAISVRYQSNEAMQAAEEVARRLLDSGADELLNIA